MKKSKTNTEYALKKTKYFKLFSEIFALLSLVAINLFVFLWLDNFELRSGNEVRVWNLFHAILPSIFFFSILRVFFNRTISFVFISFSMLALAMANLEKIKATGEPIFIMDVFNTQNIHIIKSYISTEHIAFIAFSIVATIFIARKIKTTTTIKERLFYFFIALISLPLTFYLDFSEASFKNKSLGQLVSDQGTTYISWDINANLRSNGLYLHLIQTSWAKTPTPDAAGRKKFDHLPVKFSSNEKFDGNVFFILCESCWFDDKNFKDLYAPLFNAGFKDARATSPAYGGGTVNAAFEVLTGLPADSVLNGIIYQEYHQKINQNSLTLPSALKKSGFETYAFHNFYEDFWNRKKIMPKLGFMEFHGISKMNNNGEDYFPKDKILFNHTLNNLSKNKSFYFLETVHNHGSYKDVDDYATKVSASISDISDFSEAIKKIDNNALIFVFGDHKPGMTKFFYENGIFPREYFQENLDGEINYKFGIDYDKNVVGDVPILLFNNNTELLEKTLSKANGKPLFCTSKIINDAYMKANLPAFSFNEDICAEEYDRNMKEKIHPDWIYYYSLFDKGESAE